MATDIRSLWPESFRHPGPPTPVAILRQQGILLGEKTGNLVYGEVHSRPTGPGEFLHTFEVNAPLLGYRHPLVVVTHKIAPYPAQLAPPEPSGPNKFQVQPRTTASSSEQFMEELEKFFQSQETVALLQSLVAQSEGISSDPL